MLLLLKVSLLNLDWIPGTGLAPSTGLPPGTGLPPEFLEGTGLGLLDTTGRGRAWGLDSNRLSSFTLKNKIIIIFSHRAIKKKILKVDLNKRER